MFFGILLGCLIINPLGDNWGRGTTYRLSMTLTILALFILVNANSYGILTVGLFLFGFAGSGRSGVGHIWLLEHIPED